MFQNSKYLFLLVIMLNCKMYAQKHNNEYFNFMKLNNIHKTKEFIIEKNDTTGNEDTTLNREFIYNKSRNYLIVRIYFDKYLWTEGFYEYNNKDKIVFSSFKILKDDRTIHTAQVTFYDSDERKIESLTYGEDGKIHNRTFLFYNESTSCMTEHYILFGDTNTTISCYTYNEDNNWVKKTVCYRTSEDTANIIIRIYYDNNRLIDETEYWKDMINYSLKKTYKYNYSGQLTELEKIDKWENKEFSTYFHYDNVYRTSSQMFENGKLVESLIYKYILY